MSAAKLESHADPQKPPYFYLSYAPAEDKQKVQKFFDDLSDSIRKREGLPLTEIVGCCDAVAENAGDREAGLRTSRVMIALLSQSYFRDKTAGRDWRIFEIRKEKSDAAGTRMILPVLWSPYSGPRPVVISQTRTFNENGGQQSESVLAMLRSREKRRDYEDFVTNLANYIVDSTASFQLPEIESIPDEVSDAFENVEEPPINSQTITDMPNKPQNQNINQNFLMLDGPFVKSIAEQLKETGGQPVGSSNAAVEEDGKYSVVFVDDNKDFLDLMETVCNYSDLLSCEVSQHPQEKLNEWKLKWHQYESAPDLFVVDLDFEAEGLAGKALLEALAKKDGVPSAILAASGDFSGNRLFEVTNLRRGIGAISKPYKMQELLDRMRHWAKIGRKRVARAKKTYAYLVTRTERPVFLSYSSLDEDVATFINNGFEDDDIEVFYAPIAIRGGDEVDPAIAKGLQNAKVFLPLISNNFARSNPCIAELVNACDLKERRTKDRPLDIIPIFYDTPDTALQNEHVQECLRQNQGVKMSSKNRTEGLQELLVSVQHRLRVQVTKA